MESQVHVSFRILHPCSELMGTMGRFYLLALYHSKNVCFWVTPDPFQKDDPLSTGEPHLRPLFQHRMHQSAISFAENGTNPVNEGTKKHRIRDANCGQDIIVLVEKEQNFYTRPKAPTYVSLLPNGPAYAICIQWWGQLVACGFDWSWFRNGARRNAENKTLNCRRSPFDRTQWNGRSH